MDKIAVIVTLFGLVVVSVGQGAFGQSGQMAHERDSLGDTQEALIAREQGFWAARQHSRSDFFAANLAEDAVAVTATGLKRKTEVVRDTKNPGCIIKRYSLANFETVRLSKNVFLLTYAAEQEITCGSEQLPTHVYASSIYVLRAGPFLRIFHQETPRK